MTLDSWSFIQTLLNISSLFSNFSRIIALIKTLLIYSQSKAAAQETCMIIIRVGNSCAAADCWWNRQTFFRTLWWTESLKSALIFTNICFSVNKDMNVRIKWHQWRTWQREADQPPAAQSLRIRTDDRLQSLSHTREQSGDHMNEGQEVCASSELKRKRLYTVTPPFFLSSCVCPDILILKPITDAAVNSSIH